MLKMPVKWENSSTDEWETWKI